MTTKSHAGHIVREFLHNPDSAFEPFFRLCLSQTLAKLRSLARLGYLLPVDHRTDSDPIEDLALDILGELFAGKPNQRYYIIYGCFCPEGPQVLDRMRDGELAARFIGLIRNFVRQQLYHQRRAVDPQLENLKRRINEVLQGKDVRQISVGGQMLAAVTNAPPPEMDTPPEWIESHLEQIAYAAYSDRRSNWCRNILEEAARCRADCPWIPVPQLVRVLIRINKALIELHLGELCNTRQPAVPDYLRREARKTALDQVQSTVLAGFVRKGRLTKVESAVHLRAVAAYLDDWLVHGDDADLKPTYLREADQSITVERYKRYKYTFERATDMAIEIAREVLKRHL